jgi:sec-independent protein translocase protein TatA
MLNNIGLPGLLLIAVVVLVLFGRGKISGMMGEVGKGITAFRKGMDDGKREIEDATAVRDVTPRPPAPTRPRPPRSPPTAPPSPTSRPNGTGSRPRLTGARGCSTSAGPR